jgi:hypothetical protein
MLFCGFHISLIVGNQKFYPYSIYGLELLTLKIFWNLGVSVFTICDLFSQIFFRNDKVLFKISSRTRNLESFNFCVCFTKLSFHFANPTILHSTNCVLQVKVEFVLQYLLWFAYARRSKFRLCLIRQISHKFSKMFIYLFFLIAYITREPMPKKIIILIWSSQNTARFRKKILRKIQIFLFEIDFWNFSGMKSTTKFRMPQKLAS